MSPPVASAGSTADDVYDDGWPANACGIRRSPGVKMFAILFSVAARLALPRGIEPLFQP